MNQRIKRISPTSLAKTLAVIYFLIGLFIGLFGVIGGISGANVSLNGPVHFSGTGATMIWFSFAYPFITSFFGAIGGLILAVIYNFSVRFTDGIVITVEESRNY